MIQNSGEPHSVFETIAVAKWYGEQYEKKDVTIIPEGSCGERLTDLQRIYAAQVTRLDSDVGRLLDTLEALKFADNTLVIIAGDSGSSFAPNSEIGKLFDQTMGASFADLNALSTRAVCVRRASPVGRE